ncbi:hypothetical protein TNCV_3792161 [Trichonephila clavipes]|nr:hypothetical protein TNCV_3792161 [Trichonephila clavipes]
MRTDRVIVLVREEMEKHGGQVVHRGWFVVGLLYRRLRVRPQPKSVDFHDAGNRQRPCRMIIRHVKDPKSVCLDRALSAQLKPSTGSNSQSSGASLWGGN